MRKYFFTMVLLFVVVNSFAQNAGYDPTQPAQPGDYSGVGDSSSSHGLQLSAIFLHPNNYTVVINGKVLHKGDKVQGFTIASISKNSVTLLSNANESVELKFVDLNFKQSHQ